MDNCFIHLRVSKHEIHGQVLLRYTAQQWLHPVPSSCDTLTE